MAAKPLRVHRLDPQRDRLGSDRVDRGLDHLDRHAGADQRAEQHVAAGAGRGVDPEGGHRAARAHPGREHAGAVAVVDVDHGHAGRAGVEHREQRGQPAERGAVADAGRHRDERYAGQPADHGGQRALHAGDDDQAVGGLEPVADAEQPVQPGDADVVDQVDAGAVHPGGQRGLGGDRGVGGAGGDDRDGARAASGAGRASPPGRPRRCRPRGATSPPGRAPRRRAGSRARRGRGAARAGCAGSRRPGRASCRRRTRPRGRRCGARGRRRRGRSRGRDRRRSSTGRTPPAARLTARCRLSAHGCWLGRTVTHDVESAYAQGTPSYVELMTPDQQAAKEFYGAAARLGVRGRRRWARPGVLRRGAVERRLGRRHRGPDAGAGGPPGVLGRLPGRRRRGRGRRQGRCRPAARSRAARSTSWTWAGWRAIQDPTGARVNLWQAGPEHRHRAGQRARLPDLERADAARTSPVATKFYSDVLGRRVGGDADGGRRRLHLPDGRRPAGRRRDAAADGRHPAALERLLQRRGLPTRPSARRARSSAAGELRRRPYRRARRVGRIGDASADPQGALFSVHAEPADG